MSRFTNFPGAAPLTDDEAQQQMGLARRVEAEQNPLGAMLTGSTLGLTGAVQSSAGNVLGAAGNVLGAAGFDDASRALYDSGASNAQAAQQLTPAEANWENVDSLGGLAQFVGLNAAAMPISTAPGLAGAVLTRGMSPAAGAFAGSAIPLHGENVQRLNADPTLSGMSEQEKLLRAGGAALPQAALESIVPAGVVSGATGRLAKNLAPGAQPIVRGVGAVAGSALVEGGTELGQQVIQQGMHTAANPARDTSGDRAELVQSFAAGAAGGAGPGLYSGAQAALDTAPADANPGGRFATDMLRGGSTDPMFDRFIEHITGEKRGVQNYDTPPEVAAQGVGATMDYAAQRRQQFLDDAAASDVLSPELKARVAAGDPTAEREAKAHMGAAQAADVVRGALGALGDSVRRRYGPPQEPVEGHASFDGDARNSTFMVSAAVEERAKKTLARGLGIDYDASAPGVDEALGELWGELQPLVQARFLKPDGDGRIPEDIVQVLGGEEAAHDLLLALSDATYSDIADRSASRVALDASRRARGGMLSALQDVVTQNIPDNLMMSDAKQVTQWLAAVLDRGITRENKASVDQALRAWFGDRGEQVLTAAEKIVAPSHLQGQLGGAQVSQEEFALHQADDLDRAAQGEREGTSDDASFDRVYDDIAGEVRESGETRAFVPRMQTVTNANGSVSRLRDKGENREAVRRLVEMQERHPDLDVRITSLFDAAGGDVAQILDMLPEEEAADWSRRMQQGSPAQQRELPTQLVDEARTRYAVTAAPRADDIGRMEGDVGVFTQADLARVAMNKIGQKGANKNSVDNPLVTGEHTALWVKLADGVRMPSTRTEQDETATDGKPVKGEYGIMTQRDEAGATWMRVSGQKLMQLAQSRTGGQGHKGRMNPTEAWSAGMSALMTSGLIDAEAGIQQAAPTQNERGETVGARVKGADGRTRFRLQPAKLDASYKIVGGPGGETGSRVAKAQASKDKRGVRDRDRPVMPMTPWTDDIRTLDVVADELAKASEKADAARAAAEKAGALGGKEMRPRPAETERLLAKLEKAERQVEFLTGEFDSIRAEEAAQLGDAPVERMAFGDEQQDRESRTTYEKTKRLKKEGKLSWQDGAVEETASVFSDEQWAPAATPNETEEMAEAANDRLDRTERMVDETTGEELVSTVPRQDLIRARSPAQRAEDRAQQAERNARSAEDDAQRTQDEARSARREKIQNTVQELDAAVAAPGAFILDDFGNVATLGERVATTMHRLVALVGYDKAKAALRAAFDQVRAKTDTAPAVFTSFTTAKQAQTVLAELVRRIDALRITPKQRLAAKEQQAVVMSRLFGAERDLAAARDEMGTLASMFNSYERGQIAPERAAQAVANDVARSETRRERADEEAATELPVTADNAIRIYAALLDTFEALGETKALERLQAYRDQNIRAPEGLDVLARARQYLASKIQHDETQDVVDYDGERWELENDWAEDAGHASMDNGQSTVSDEQRAEVEAIVAKLVGDVEVKWQKLIKDNPAIAGFFQLYKNGKEQIQLALHAMNPRTVAYHESMHAFFSRAQRSDDEGVQRMHDLLAKVVMSPLVARQLRAKFATKPLVLMAMGLEPSARVPAEGSQAHKDLVHERMAYYFQLYANGDLKPLSAARGALDKITNFFRALVGLLTDEQKFDAVMRAFADGRMATPSAMAQTYAGIEAREKALDKMWELTEPARTELSKWFIPATNTLMAYKSENMDWVRRQFYNEVTDKDRDMGLLPAKDKAYNEYVNRWARSIEGATEEERAAAYDILIGAEQDMKGQGFVTETGVERVDEIVANTLKVLEDLWRYQHDAGVKRLVVNDGEMYWADLGFITGYFPRVWDFAKIDGNQERFVELLLQDKYRADLEAMRSQFPDGAAMTIEQVAEALADQMSSTEAQVLDAPVDPNGSKAELQEEEGRLGYVPWAQHVNVRALNWIDPADFKAFFNDNLTNIMGTYIRQATHKAEYARRFGHDGGKLRERMGAELKQRGLERFLKETGRELAWWEGLTKEGRGEERNTAEYQAAMDKAAEELQPAARAVMAMEGTLGHDINPLLRKALGGAMVYQNIRLMALTLFANVMDVAGIAVRTGEMKDAWGAFKRGMREIGLQYKGKAGEDATTRILEEIGAVEVSTVMSSFGDLYAGDWMQGALKKVNDKIFELNGMTAWNRGQRIYAGETALRDIPKLVQRSRDSDRTATRQLKELGLRPGDNIVLENGELNLADTHVQDAVVRWVNSSVLRPNAAHRPTKGSDPHWAVLYQFKQFTYSFSKVILKRMAHEYKMGNQSPVYQFAALAVPVIIASDIARAALTHGGDLPGYMQAYGPGDWAWHGVQRSGMLGYGQMGVDTAEEGVFGSLLGPSVDQVADAFSEDPYQTAVEAAPLSTVIRPALL